MRNFVVMDKSFFTLDKTMLRKTTFAEQGNDFAYWQTQSPDIRLQVVELLRRQYHGYSDDDNEQRLQRVYRFVKLK